MPYKVLKDFKGSPDGFTVIEFKKDQDIDELEPSLAAVALAEKWVKKTGDKTRAQLAAEAAAAKEAARAALVAQGEVLQAKLDAAADADKPAIQAEIDALAAEFQALG